MRTSNEEPKPSPILIRGGRVLDPASDIDGICDLLLVDGKVAALEKGRPIEAPQGTRIIQASGLVVTPGFVDIHTHLREPGQEYKEDLQSGTLAAAAGGFTTICCMPNTVPVNDDRAVTELIVRRAKEVGSARVYPIGAISKGLKGESLAEMAEMKDAGIVAVSDDGKPVMNGELMRRAMEYAHMLGLLVIQHCEDLHLAQGGVMNEGSAATRAGLRGQPSCAESSMVARDLEICAFTGTPYHVAHISTAASVRLVRQAKQRGLPVSAEVTPHHFTLTDAACCGYDTSTKVAPPLRTKADIEALKAGLADGTIDCIATDHAPHAAQEKDLEFDNAAFGMIGLETALPLSLRLVEQGVLSLPKLIAALTCKPADLLKLPAGTLRIGAPADVAIFDPNRRWTVDRAQLRSKSKNTPFHGWEVCGRVTMTLLAGHPVYEEVPK